MVLGSCGKCTSQFIYDRLLVRIGCGRLVCLVLLVGIYALVAGVRSDVMEILSVVLLVVFL